MSDVRALKTYLGDGLYAAYDGYHVILTAADGACECGGLIEAAPDR